MQQELEKQNYTDINNIMIKSYNWDLHGYL